MEVDVEPHQIEQFRVAHLGQIDFGAAFEHVLRQLLLGPDQLVDALLDGATANELVRQHIAVLADAPGAVGGLVFHGGVPPAVEVDHMRGGGQVQSGAARLERQHEERAPFVLLEALDEFATFAHRRAAVQHQAFAPEDIAQKSRQRRGDLPELGEDQHLFLLGGDGLGDFGQPRELAAVVPLSRRHRRAIAMDDCRSA